MNITTGLDAVIAQDEEKAVVTIFQKNGDAYLAPDGSECTVTLLGMESKRVKAALDKNTRALLQAKRQKREPKDVLAARIRVVIAAMTGWHGWVLDDAATETAQLNDANVRLLVRADHILDQVEAGIAGHADFFLKN